MLPDFGPDCAIGRHMYYIHFFVFQRLFGVDSYTPYVKDAFHRYLINGEKDAIQPKGRGTKVAGYYKITLEPGKSYTIDCRLTADGKELGNKAFDKFDNIFDQRLKEADHFYTTVLPGIQWYMMHIYMI